MKRHIAVATILLTFLLAAGSAQAATTDTITVTVSLQSVISVSVTPNTWNITPLALTDTAPSPMFTATVGNTATRLQIKATNAAGGWTLGSPPALDRFSVTVTSPPLTLTTANQTLAASVTANGSVNFNLTYAAPTDDSKGAGVAQGFTITLTASSP